MRTIYDTAPRSAADQLLVIAPMTEKPAPFPPQGNTPEVEHGTLFQPKFDAAGLITAVVIEAQTGDVLMVAWMDAEALRLTLSTREAHFYSRSRRRIWKKGEDSGNVLRVQDIRTDCDQDTLLIPARVEGHGVACHTGARSCFYRAIDLDAPDGSPVTLVPVTV